jgi:hypothetical protein
MTGNILIIGNIAHCRGENNGLKNAGLNAS